MSLSELEQDSYDVVVLGTGVAESIAAAALANAGQSVLHLDPNDYYGGPHASLTLDELVSWASARSGHPGTPSPANRESPYFSAQRARYSRVTHTRPGAQLLADRRRYALSLSPAVVPARGAMIDTLVDSGVSKYVSFRLLDGVSVWDGGAGGFAAATPTEPAAAASDSESADRAEPSSVAAAESAEPLGVSATDDATAAAPQNGAAGPSGERARFRRVPGSKEDIFRDRSIALADKRRLMKFLLFAAGDYAADPLYAEHASKPLPSLLETFSIPPPLLRAITYALAHAPAAPHADAAAAPALARLARYLAAAGRYGPSPFLVAQYGGAGEVAQAFCRACAVKGGTYVLGRAGDARVEWAGTSGERGAQGAAGARAATSASGVDVAQATNAAPGTDRPPGRLRVTVPAHPRPIRARWVLASPDYLSADVLSRAGPSGSGPASGSALDGRATRAAETTAHCIAIATARPAVLGPAGEGAADGDDTALVVFPPKERGGPDGRGGQEGQGELVRALIMGEGTGSCPAGQYIIYLVSLTARDPAFLAPYLRALAPPAFELYYTHHAEAPSGADTASPAAPGAGERTDANTDAHADTHAAAHADRGDGNGDEDGNGDRSGLVVLRPYAGAIELTESLDYEAAEARRAVRAVLGDGGWFVRDEPDDDDDAEI
ncbi:hypothetical protein Q5752_005503 [Cryptotrichosporon argae]